MQTVWQGQCAAAGLQTTGVVPRILSGQRVELQGGARLWEGVAVFEPGDLQLVESTECRTVQSDAAASSQLSVTIGSVYPHCVV